jgi:hypothetical protein
MFLFFKSGHGTKNLKHQSNNKQAARGEKIFGKNGEKNFL